MPKLASYTQRAALGALIAVLLMRPGIAVADGPQDSPTALFAHMLAAYFEQGVPMPNLEQMVASNGDIHPIGPQRPASIIDGVAYDAITKLLKDSSHELHWDTLRGFVQQLGIDQAQHRRRRTNDIDETAISLPKDGFEYLEPDSVVNPDFAEASSGIDRPLWLQRAPMSVGEFKRLARYNPNLIPQGLLGISDALAVGGSTTYKLTAKQVRALLDDANDFIAGDFPLRYDLPTYSEMSYVYSATLADLYLTNPALFDTHWRSPFGLISSSGPMPQLFPATSDLVGQYGVSQPTDRGLSRSPLLIKGKPFYGLIQSVRALCWHQANNTNPYRHVAVGAANLHDELTEEVNLRALEARTQFGTRPYSLWRKLLGGHYYDQLKLCGLRLALREKGERLHYKDL